MPSKRSDDFDEELLMHLENKIHNANIFGYHIQGCEDPMNARVSVEPGL
jgi:hypothetical protein